VARAAAKRALDLAPASDSQWLANVPRPRGRDLSVEELQRFATATAARPELWRDLVNHDPAQRNYAELESDEFLTAWLICWMDDHDTGFHDHDLSAGAVAVVRGSVCEERLALNGPPLARSFSAGGAFGFSAADIHRVRHSGVEPAVTIHVYSPPLVRMGAYYIDGDGTLARRSTPAAEELRPLEAVQEAPAARPVAA